MCTQSRGRGLIQTSNAQHIRERCVRAGDYKQARDCCVTHAFIGAWRCLQDYQRWKEKFHLNLTDLLTKQASGLNPHDCWPLIKISADIYHSVRETGLSSGHVRSYLARQDRRQSLPMTVSIVYNCRLSNVWYMALQTPQRDSNNRYKQAHRHCFL